MIKNSCYYIIEKKFNDKSFNFEYGGSFYMIDGVFITHVHIKDQSIAFGKLPELDKLLDTKCMCLAKPVSITVGTHINGGYHVSVLDKNNKIIDSARYNGKLTKIDFINYQLYESKNPIQVDYEWLIGGDVTFMNIIKKQTKSNNKNGGYCLIQ